MSVFRMMGCVLSLLKGEGIKSGEVGAACSICEYTTSECSAQLCWSFKHHSARPREVFFANGLSWLVFQAEMSAHKEQSTKGSGEPQSGQPVQNRTDFWIFVHFYFVPPTLMWQQEDFWFGLLSSNAVG